MKLTNKILTLILVTSMLFSCFSFAAVSAADDLSNQDVEVSEFCLTDSNDAEIVSAPIESEDDKLYLKASITNNSSADKEVFLAIARYQDTKLDGISKKTFDLAAGQTLQIAKGTENELSIDLVNGRNNAYKIFAWDAGTNAPFTTAKEYKDKDKIIFIGNSLTFYGGTVINADQTWDDASKAKRMDDKGYFYHITKQNNMEMHVTNWTWGGHGIDDNFGICAANRGHNGMNHLGQFRNNLNKKYDYVVIQPTNRTATTKAALKEQINLVRDEIKTLNPNAEYFLLIPNTYYSSDTDEVQTTIRSCLPSVAKEENVKVLTWGRLVYDIINKKATVEGATQTYNKNSFIVSQTASDGYHPNQLTGYITTQYVFSAITGKKAVGENYAFCTDASLNSAFDVDTFKSKHYTYGDKATNYPEIFESPADMLGIQKLIDKYVEEDLTQLPYDDSGDDNGDDSGDNSGDDNGDNSGDDNGDNSGDLVIEDNLLFNLDFSGFDKSVPNTWGLTNNAKDGDEVTITARDGYNSTYNLVTGVSTKESFKDPNGNTVDYIYQEPWNIGTSTRSQNTENTRIIIENKEWATKATTTEIWAYKYQNNNNNRFLNFFRDADTTDRSAFDKIIYVNRNASSQEVLVYRNGSTNVESKKTSITKSGDYNWYLFTLVATPVDTDSDNVADSMKYELQIDDKRSATLVVTVPMSADEIYGIVLGSTTNGCYYAPKQFGVASVKVYDGALTTEEVTAHYNAQKASFTNISMKDPAFSSVTPEAGSSLLSNEGEFTVKFTTGGTATYIDEASLEKGIVLRDAEGNEIPSVKTLESGKKTVTVKADNLPEGQITLSVTTKLLSTNGKSIKTQVDKTYTVTAQ